MGGDEKGDPLLPGQGDEFFPKTIPSDGVDAGGGLIEDEQLRRMDHCHGEGQALTHAQGQFLGAGLQIGFQTEARRQFRDALGNPPRRQPIEPGVEIQVAPHADLAIEGEGLGHKPQALAQGRVLGRHRLTEDPGLAGAGWQQPSQHAHGGRFAAAVRTEKTKDLPWMNVQADVRHGDEVPKAATEPQGADRRLPIVGPVARGDDQSAMATALGRRQQGDEDRLQVLFAGARPQIRQATLGQDLARVHRHQEIEAGRLLHVGGGHQHAQIRAALTQAVHQFPEAAPGQGVHAGGGLVEDQQVRLVDEGAAQAQLLLHTAGQIHGGAIGEGGEARRLGQLGDARGPGRPVLTEETTEEVQVLADRQAGIEVPPQTLGHVGDVLHHPLPPGGPAQILAQDLDLPGLNPAHPGDEAQQGGLADPIRANQPADGTGGQFQAHPRQGLHLAVGMTQLLEPDDWVRAQLRAPGGRS